MTGPVAGDGNDHDEHEDNDWSSQSDPEWRALARWVNTTTSGLDFDFYRDEVEPILLSRRPGNARCVVCHSRGGGNAHLEPLSPGSEIYDEEQSLRNCDRIQRFVVPGAPLQSVLLVNPLAEESGGSYWHGGGKHWASQDAAEWQTLARWVRGETGGAVPRGPRRPHSAPPRRARARLGRHRRPRLGGRGTRILGILAGRHRWLTTS